MLFSYYCLIFLILVQHVLFWSSILYNVYMMFLTRYKPVCTDCTQKGFTRRDTTAYRCSACGHSYGRQRFKAQDINNFQKELVKNLKCEDCKNNMHVPCALSLSLSLQSKIVEHFGLRFSAFWAPFWYLFEHFGSPGAVSGRLWAPLGA